MSPQLMIGPDRCVVDNQNLEEVMDYRTYCWAIAKTYCWAIACNFPLKQTREQRPEIDFPSW